MAASVRFTGPSVDLSFGGPFLRWTFPSVDLSLILGPGVYTLLIPDRMSCLPIPTVLQVIIWWTTIFVKMVVETANATG